MFRKMEAYMATEMLNFINLNPSAYILVIQKVYL